jgi:predicted ArsR family transcriptional regulator
MTKIVAISRETIPGFVARHRPGVFTNDVAARFGIDLKDARRELERLKRSGLVTSRRETTGANGNFAGAGLVWQWRTLSSDESQKS